MKDSSYTMIDAILEEMISDDENSINDNSRELEDLYKRSNRHDKEVINSVLIHICGWNYDGLKSIVDDKNS